MNTLKIKQNGQWVDIPGLVGPQGATGPQGPAGPAGKDGANGQNGAPGVGVPTGGSSGQILAKNSGTDYDTKWIDAPTQSSSEDNEIISYTANSYYKTEKSTLPMVWITDGAAASVQELKITYDIKQDGSGTPSPANRRDFIKQDGTQIAHYGRNLFNIDDIVSNTEGVTVTKFENGFKVTNDTNTAYSNIFYGLDIKLNGAGAVSTYLFFSYDGPAAASTTYRYSTNFGNTWGASSNSWVPAYVGYGTLSMTSGITNLQPVRSLNAHSSITITNPIICLVDNYGASKSDIPYVPYNEYSDIQTVEFSDSEENHYQWEYDCVSGEFISKYEFISIDRVSTLDNSDNTILLDFWSEAHNYNYDLNLIKCNYFDVNSTNFTVKDNKLYLKQAAWSQLGSTLAEVNTAIGTNPIQLLIPYMINYSFYTQPYPIDVFRGGNTFWTKNGIISSITYATTGIDFLSNVNAKTNAEGTLQYNSTTKTWEPRDIETLVWNCSTGAKGFRVVSLNYDEALEKYYISEPSTEFYWTSEGVPLILTTDEYKYNSDVGENQYKTTNYQLISANYETVFVEGDPIDIYTFRFLKVDDDTGTFTPIIFKSTITSTNEALLVNNPDDIFDDGWSDTLGGGT